MFRERVGRGDVSDHGVHMKLAILSRSPKCYSTRRLYEAGVSRGHKIRILDTLRFAIALEEENPELFHRGRRVPQYDAVIPRIGASITYFGTAVVRQFEQMGVFCANSALGIGHSRDKLRTLQILSKHDIGIPPTAYVRNREEIIPAIERLGGAPVVIKVLEGTQGVGVILAETVKVAEAIVETLQFARQNVLIQRFVAESRGRDIRALVIGDRVVAAMRRMAQGQEYRANVHRGGKTEAIDLDGKYEQTALRAAQIVGLRIAGVDMLETAGGPQVIEVNSSPGLEGIEQATRRDVAGAIVDYVHDQTDFPDMDLRQRLTVSKGYGAAEVPIPAGSPLAGKTIEEASLRDQDVVVLTIHRGKNVISNPKSSRVLEVGDRLLCFGKLEAMKSLIPARKPRRVRKLKKADIAAGHSIPSATLLASAPVRAPSTDVVVAGSPPPVTGTLPNGPGPNQE
jgi:ribosomal protein S6--L-glutamate ligase